MSGCVLRRLGAVPGVWARMSCLCLSGRVIYAGGENRRRDPEEE